MPSASAADGRSDDAPAASVLIELPSTSSIVAATSQFTVSVADAVDASGFAFSLNFDPTVIRIEQLELGSFAPECSVQVRAIEAESGRVDFACITVPLTGVSGSGVIAEIDFTCIRAGSAGLELERVEVTDSLARSIEVDVEAGQVTCQEDGT